MVPKDFTITEKAPTSIVPKKGPSPWLWNLREPSLRALLCWARCNLAYCCNPGVGLLLNRGWWGSGMREREGDRAREREELEIGNWIAKLGLKITAKIQFTSQTANWNKNCMHHVKGETWNATYGFSLTKHVIVTNGFTLNCNTLKCLVAMKQ